MPGTHNDNSSNFHSLSFTSEIWQVNDAGIYQAKLVSTAGECYSSCLHVEVESGPDWKGVRQPRVLNLEHYGAEMAPVMAAGQTMVSSRQEGERHCEKYGVSTLHFRGLSNWTCPSGWIEGTVGSWEVKHPWETEEAEMEAEDAIEAEMCNSLNKRFRNSCPDDLEGMGLERVSENVRQAISRMRMEKDMDLKEKLDANLDSVLRHLDEEDDWPDQRTLLKSKENMLVDSSLNHTWQTHLQWEQGQADAWRKSFAEDPVEMLRWTGFRSKKVQSDHKLRLDTSDSSSSYSMSSSDSDEEQSDSGAVPPAPISIRFDEEEEEEEEVISGLDKLLLSHHNEDQVPK